MAPEPRHPMRAPPAPGPARRPLATLRRKAQARSAAQTWALVREQESICRGPQLELMQAQGMRRRGCLMPRRQRL
jgi:hypothetical protein